MASYDFSASRLFVASDLRAGHAVPADRAQSNYLLNVLRLGDGDEVLLFNGRDGEWRSRIEVAGRRSAIIEPIELTRPQPAAPTLSFLFAPLKHARLDYMVQKAVEMGAGRLQPVFTARTVASRVNRERMGANAVEAAEQCGILSIPEILVEAKLEAAVTALPPDVVLVFSDEDAPVRAPCSALDDVAAGHPCALLVGPEGGFTEGERAFLLARGQVRRLSLGPRILRADTAAVAALAIVQATFGDWR